MRRSSVSSRSTAPTAPGRRRRCALRPTDSTASFLLPAVTLFALGLSIVVAPQIAVGFASELDRQLSDESLTPAARAAVADAKSNPLTLPELSDVSTAERGVISDAVSESSVSGFRLGVVAAGGLVLFAGLLGAGLRNPLRVVAARGCAGGHLVAAPLDAARRTEEYARGAASSRS